MSWAVVNQLVQKEEETQFQETADVVDGLSQQNEPSLDYPVARSCLLTLHYLWESNSEEFVKILSGTPMVQRKYIWSINHISRWVKCKKIRLEHGKITDHFLSDSKRSNKRFEKRSFSSFCRFSH